MIYSKITRYYLSLTVSLTTNCTFIKTKMDCIVSKSVYEDAIANIYKEQEEFENKRQAAKANLLGLVSQVTVDTWLNQKNIHIIECDVNSEYRGINCLQTEDFKEASDFLNSRNFDCNLSTYGAGSVLIRLINTDVLDARKKALDTEAARERLSKDANAFHTYIMKQIDSVTLKTWIVATEHSLRSSIAYGDGSTVVNTTIQLRFSCGKDRPTIITLADLDVYRLALLAKGFDCIMRIPYYAMDYFIAELKQDESSMPLLQEFSTHKFKFPVQN